MVVSSGGGHPIDRSSESVGAPRPEASTTRSAAIVSLVPSSSAERTPVTIAPSGDANTSMTRQRCRSVILAWPSTRRRSARSIAGRDAA
jgi:hypothetical protein